MEEKSNAPTMRFSVVGSVQLDHQCILANVGGEAFELQSLESSPSEEGSVRRREFAEVLGEVFASKP